jgi:amino acid adenylation domain-containing protein
MTLLPSIPDLFTSAVTAQPNRIAIAGTDLTYAVLDRQTAALAHALAERGVRRGERVAVWLSKSPEYVLTIFAALRAGAAYVPLDAGQPVARVATILADAEPSALVTSRSLLRQLAALPASVRSVWLVGEAVEPGWSGSVPELSFEEARAGGGRARAAAPVALTDLAAILYTSGSTGTPKGVMITHLNLANFIGWATREMGLGTRDVVANHASFNFDLSTFDLFAATSAGACLWIVPDQDTGNVITLARGIAEHRVSVWYSVPSVLTLMLDAGVLTQDVLVSMRCLLFAGEVFPIKHLRRLRELLPRRARLYNLYGPTETNVCTYYRVDQIDPARQQPVPIGRPITGARVWVVDPDDRPVAAGECGELVVEGVCVTPGYFRRTDDRNSDNHARHRHATGDLVSYEGDDLVYRGRSDRMIKVRGFRVELGEIEAALMRHPGIREAAALAVGPDPDGGQRLIAFCSFEHASDALPLLEVKRHCSAYLPRYMIPHSVVCLAALPRNANGKIDHRALRELAEGMSPGPHAIQPGEIQ